MRSARVDFPWSTWAMMEKLRMRPPFILPMLRGLRGKVKGGGLMAPTASLG
jgi:hypothetical protein